MIIRRLAVGTFSGLLLSAGGLLLATSASAAPTPSLPTPSLPAAAYPPVSQTVGFSSSDVRVGETITVTADGFKPLSAATVTTSAGGVLGTGRVPGSVAMVDQAFHVYPATADSLGVVTATVRFDEPGEHTVTISGITAAGLPRSVSSTVNVGAAAPPVSGGTTTPRTVPGAADEESSNLLEYGAIGAAALVLVGLGVVSLRVRAKRAAVPVRRTPAMPLTGPAHPAPVPANASATVAYPDGLPSTPPAPVSAPMPEYAPVAAQAPAQFPG